MCSYCQPQEGFAACSWLCIPLSFLGSSWLAGPVVLPKPAWSTSLGLWCHPRRMSELFTSVGLICPSGAPDFLLERSNTRSVPPPTYLLQPWDIPVSVPAPGEEAAICIIAVLGGGGSGTEGMLRVYAGGCPDCETKIGISRPAGTPLCLLLSAQVGLWGLAFVQKWGSLTQDLMSMLRWACLTPAAPQVLGSNSSWGRGSRGNLEKTRAQASGCHPLRSPEQHCEPPGSCWWLGRMT